MKETDIQTGVAAMGSAAGSNMNNMNNKRQLLTMKQNSLQQPTDIAPFQHYSLPGVLHYLQSEWRVIERERNLWEIEQADLKARVAFLEGERQALEHLKSDLLRRVKMLEYSLRQERSKYMALAQKQQVATASVVTLSAGSDLQSSPTEIPTESSQIVPTNYSFSSVNLQEISTAMQNPYIPSSNEENQDHSAPSRINSDESKSITVGGNGLMLPVNIIDSMNSLPQSNGALLSFSKGYGNLRSRELLKSYLKEADSLLATTTWASSASRKRASCVSAQNDNTSPPVSQNTVEYLSNTNSASSGVDASSNPHYPTEARQQSAPTNFISAFEVNRRSSIERIDVSNTKPFQNVESMETDHSIVSQLNKTKLDTSDTELATLDDQDVILDHNRTIRKGATNKVAVHFAVADDQNTMPDNETSDIVNVTDLQKRVVLTSKGEFAWQLRDTLKSHFDSVRDVAFHPKKMVLFSASEDHTVKMWSVRNNDYPDIEPMHTFRGHKDVVTTLAVSEEGDRVYSAGGDATICMWQIPQLDMPLYPAYNSKLKQHIYVGHSDMIWDLRLHPMQSQTSLLASASADGTVKLWDTTLANPSLKTTLWYHGTANRSVKSGLTGQSAPISNKEYETPTITSWTHTDLTKLIVGYRNGVVKLFDIETGTEVLQFEASLDSTAGSQVNALACHPFQSLAITGHEDNTIRLFDIQSGKCVHSMAAHSDAVTCLDISPGGLAFVSGGHDCSLRWWDLGTRRCIQEQSSHRRKYDEGVWSVAYHPYFGDVMASGGSDGTCRVYLNQNTVPDRISV
ncbi:hypothetical protein BDV3_002495 [Batrachochytrium dendrobatidis]|uniref:Striatin family protein n=1 Tax=Batrachochytrium dendrobatidis (strain JEL423) TaxID=403673 RepID=A0A177WW29_BATDL|nr:striatin family protein [Batrachochytrium dendrobatidis JEL423]